jgi:hypothetical protein
MRVLPQERMILQTLQAMQPTHPKAAPSISSQTRQETLHILTGFLNRVSALLVQ